MTPPDINRDRHNHRRLTHKLEQKRAREREGGGAG